MSQNIDFETALLELEKTVALLEKGDVSLSDSIELFEKGMKYTKICSEHIEKAKLVVKNLDDTVGE